MTKWGKLLYSVVWLNASLRMCAFEWRKSFHITENEKTKTERNDFVIIFQHSTAEFFLHQVLASTAVRGILLGLGLAISLLVVMTSNWLVGLLCGAIISCITVGVVGVIPLAGWKLGVLESLNLTLVVGLAVDYVVHLADGYVRSQKQSRQDKVRETLSHVGISVLSGACTSLGASVFMVAAKILFFFQFGIFMFCTIGLSIIYALIMFTTILGIFGPEGNTGSLEPFYNWCRRKTGRPMQEEIPCDDFTGPGCQSPAMRSSKTATPL